MSKPKKKPAPQKFAWQTYNEEIYGRLTSACLQMDSRRNNGAEYIK